MDNGPDLPLEAELKARGFLTRKDIAARHAVHPGVVAKWVALGHLSDVRARDSRSLYYDPEEVALLPHKLRPIGRPKKEPPEGDDDDEEAAEMAPEITSLADSEDDDDDDDGPPQPPAMGVKQALGHFAMAPAMIIKHVTAAMKQAQGAMRDMMAPVNQLMTSVTAAAHLENERLRARCAKLEDKNWKMLEDFQSLLDNQHARAVREREAKERTEIVRGVAGKVADLAPLVMSYVGDKFDSNNPALKEAALVNIVDKLDPEALQAIIGTGVLDQTAVMTLLSVKERRVKEEEERLKRKAAEEAKEAS